MQIDIPCFGSSSIHCGMMRPYATTRIASGANLFKQRAKLGIVFDLLRLHHRKTPLQRNPLHRWNLQRHPPARSAIRLRHHEPDIMPCIDHSLEHRHRELGRSTKNQSHRSSSTQA